MRRGRARLSLALCLSLILATSVCGSALAKIPVGFRDIKLGMSKTQVMDLLKKSRDHFSYDDFGQEIREIVRGDELFRYATYSFNPEGVLVEISLQMREILGRDRVLELYNSQYGLSISPRQATVDANTSIEVHGDALVIKAVASNDMRSAKRP